MSAALDWLDSLGWVCSSHPASGRHMVTAVIDGEGERWELNITQWMAAHYCRSCGRSWPYAGAVMSDLAKWHRYEWSSIVTPWCWTQRPRPFSRWLPDGSIRSRMLVAVFVRYTDFLSADMGCVLYIGLQIFTLWQRSKVRVRIIFDGVLYSKFYSNRWNATTVH